MNEEITEEVEKTSEEPEVNIEELKAQAARAKELEEQLREKEEELEKYSDKEFNFNKFRKATKEEKDKMMEEFSEKERTLTEEVAKINERLEANEKRTLSDARDNVLFELGADEDMAKRLDEEVKEFLGTPTDAADVRRRYMKAYRIVAGGQPKASPLNRFAPVTGYPEGPSKKDRYTDTKEGKANMKQWFGIDIK